MQSFLMRLLLEFYVILNSAVKTSTQFRLSYNLKQGLAVDSFKAIIWFVLICASTAFIFTVVGWSGLTGMFPEGRRWWHFPVQLLSLVIFAALVLNHPF